MGKYFEILLERKKEREEYFKNLKKYLSLIKKRAQKILGNNTKVILFGSYLTDKFNKALSDIDILVISPKLEYDPNDPFKRARILTYIKKGLGSYHLFEIHLATLEEYNNWYKNFIKDKFKEI